MTSEARAAFEKWKLSIPKGHGYSAFDAFQAGKASAQGCKQETEEKAWILPDKLKRFLEGETTIDGYGFGDRKNNRPYWWRSLLRELKPAHPKKREGL